jgi:hypothetical protein
MRAGRAGAAVAMAVFIALAASAPPASATFHEVMIREAYPGSSSKSDSEYVELQAWSAGQNFVQGHSISLFSSTGKLVGSATFASDVPRGTSQSTLLAATPVAVSEFGVAADVELPSGALDPAGGAVCWESLDCVAWGNFSGSVNGPVGQPATPAGIPDGMALRRTIAPGCPTLLDPADDSDNSAADFSPAFPGPRPNSVPPSEHACPSGAGSGAGSGSPAQSGGRPPQTKFRHKPPVRTSDRTPTFRFSSNEADARFECKLDRGRFKACHSPFTTRRLRFGRHTFRVRAREPSGQPDPSPATYGFKVIPSPR